MSGQRRYSSQIAGRADTYPIGYPMSKIGAYVGCTELIAFCISFEYEPMPFDNCTVWVKDEHDPKAICEKWQAAHPVKTCYEVHVGNIGLVYSGESEDEARRHFMEYVQQAKQLSGRASGEDVTLFKDGEPVEEHVGFLNQEDE